MPATTLRYYEDIGLIGPAHRAPNDYRTFNERDLERLALITRAKKLDISLEDVRDLVAAWDSEECGTVQHRFGDLVAARLRETRERIAELADLADLLEQTGARLSGTPQEGACTDSCACTAPPTGPEAPPLAPPAGAALLTLLPAAVQPAAEALAGACTLERSALPKRLEDWTRLTATATGRADLDEGIALDFGHDPALTAEIARLAAEEYECCSFFAFTLVVNASGLRLEVRAPDHARDALRAVFGAPW